MNWKNVMDSQHKASKPASETETIWQSVDPGGNGWLICASIHPASGHLFFSSDMGFSLYRSMDRGDTWQPIANPTTGTPCWVAGDPGDADTLYMSQVGASPRSSGIWKSTDNGETWQHIFRSEAFGKSSSQSGLVDPSDRRVLYWTVATLGVWRSADGGESWQDISTGLPLERLEHCENHCHALELAPNNPPGRLTLYYPTNLGLYRWQESDGGWRLVDGLPARVCTRVSACESGAIYAAFPEHGVYASLDGGHIWKLLPALPGGRMPLHIAAARSQPGLLYVATIRDRGVYCSTDGGQTFRLVTHRRFTQDRNWPVNYRQLEAVSSLFLLIDPLDPQTLYLDYNKKTHDGGQTWQHYGTRYLGNDRWAGTGLSLLTEYRAVFDPRQPGRVWLGFSDTGLMLTEDGGASIFNVYSGHRSEVNHVARLRDQLVFSSGSCVSIAVDPHMPTSLYASINGKNADCRAAVGGIVIKSVNGGRDWSPIYKKHGLADGIVREIVIDPASPPENRTVYVASYGNGVYKSVDDGHSFILVTPPELFGGNTRLMCLKQAPADSSTLYLGVGGTDGIRPIHVGPQGYPPLTPGQYGGVYKSSDGGETWKKVNHTRELPSVIDLAVHPEDPQTVYAATWAEKSLVPVNSSHPEWREGGIFKTSDGGETWQKVFAPPDDGLRGTGGVEAICINPLLPEIIYAAVMYYGVFRSLDGGATWTPLGQASMDRKQRRFHSICVNPHAPHEIWLAHFGASFSTGVDHMVKTCLEAEFGQANFVRNPRFAATDTSGQPCHWQVWQPPAVGAEPPVLSVTPGQSSARFNLSAAYVNRPTIIPAFLEQRRLEQEGQVTPLPAWQKVMDELGGQSTRAWVSQELDPYFTSLLRGRDVRLEMDVFIVQRSSLETWERWYDSAEVPLCPPQASLTEVRDFNVHWVVAETSLEDLEEANPSAEFTRRWLHCAATGRVSENARWLEVTVTGCGPHAGVTDLYLDNIRLSLV